MFKIFNSTLIKNHFIQYNIKEIINKLETDIKNLDIRMNTSINKVIMTCVFTEILLLSSGFVVIKNDNDKF